VEKNDKGLITAREAATLLDMHVESFRRAVRERHWGAATPEPVEVSGEGHQWRANLYRRTDVEAVQILISPGRGAR